MTYLIIFIASGLLSILCLALWTRRSGEAVVLNGEPASLRPTGELRPAARETIANIFERQDWEFIAETAPELREAFLRERKRLALLWLVHTRRRAASLMRMHRIAVREHAELQAGTELKLAVDYWQLLCFCGLLQVMISARGPFKAQVMARFVTESASDFWAASDRMLSGLKGGSAQPNLRYLNQ